MKHVQLHNTTYWLWRPVISAIPKIDHYNRQNQHWLLWSRSHGLLSYRWRFGKSQPYNNGRSKMLTFSFSASDTGTHHATVIMCLNSYYLSIQFWTLSIDDINAHREILDQTIPIRADKNGDFKTKSCGRLVKWSSINAAGAIIWVVRDLN